MSSLASLPYNDITGDIAARLIEFANENADSRKRARILSEIVDSKDFELIHQSLEKKTVTKVFRTIRKDDPEYGDNVNGAKSLNSIGYDVYMLPRISGRKSFDYILVKGKKVCAAELKTVYGKNSLDNRLEKANEQSDRVVLNIVGNITSRNAAGEIRSFYLNNPHIKEIIVLKSGKPMPVDYRHVTRKSFTQTFMSLWAR
jgi:hypothetical protein